MHHLLQSFIFFSLLTTVLYGKDFFMEENDMRFPVTQMAESNITYEQFDKTIKELRALYKDEAYRLGGTLYIYGDWANPKVNAYAIRLGQGFTWEIFVFGGLARHPEMTLDGLSLVICHEIGHHLGGAPKIKGFLGRKMWASNEGQSDYFATLKCGKKYFEKENNIEFVKGLNVPSYVTNECSKRYSGAQEIALCQRLAMASKAVVSIFQDGHKVNFETPSKKKVWKTDDKHPASQCRLDSYFAGVLCDKDPNDRVDQEDVEEGVCTRHEGYEREARPRCWYKP